MSWEKNYDNWKLASPYDNEPDIEVFKAEKYDYYTTNYDTIVKFDMKMLEIEKDENINLDEASEELADLLGLHLDESDAIEEYYDRK